MLLTLKPPVSNHSFRDYSPPTPPSTSTRFSPVLSSAAANTSYPTSHLAQESKRSAEVPMSTPHRALPPPAGMPLQSSRDGQMRESQLRDSKLRESQMRDQQQSSYSSQSISHVVESKQQQEQRQQQHSQQQPPYQPSSPDEWKPYWLAKAEEQKRLQEEEKTSQERLRLEQRRVESDMLRTSLTGGVPPQLVPMMFASMGGATLANTSVEWTQQYIAQIQQQQQQLQIQAGTRPPSPSRRDERHSQGYPHQLPAPLPSTPQILTGASTSPNIFVPGYNLSPASRARQLPGPSALSRQTGAPLSRLNTNEMHIQAPPTAPQPQVHSQLQGQERPLHGPAPAHNESEEQSPQLYFHHWQPPNSAANQANTTSTLPSQNQASQGKRKHRSL